MCDRLEETEEDMMPTQNMPPPREDNNNHQEMFQAENDSNGKSHDKSENDAEYEDVTTTEIIAPLENSVNVDNAITDSDGIISKPPLQNEIIQDVMTTQIKVEMIEANDMKPIKKNFDEIIEEDMMSTQNMSLPREDNNNHQEMFQAENGSNGKSHDKSENDAECEDVTTTEIIAPLENSVNVDHVITDSDGIISKPPLQNEIIQDVMTTQIKVERIETNDMKPIKKNFDEIIDQFQKALQCSINVKSEIQNDLNENVIINDKTDESKAINDDYNNASQDNKGQGEISNDTLVVLSNLDDEVLIYPVDSNITNHKTDENKITYYGGDLPSTNDSDSSDEESAPKKSKQFTFTDSDFPDSDEIDEILMSYPKPEFTGLTELSESESESSSEDESNQPISRRNKLKPTKVDFSKMFDILPERVLTRQRKQPDRYGFEDYKMISNILKPSYLTKQEGQIDANIITENMERLTTLRKGNTNKDSKNQIKVKQDKILPSNRKKVAYKIITHKKNIKAKIGKLRKRNLKSKLHARKSAAELKIKNTKEDSLPSTSAETSRRTRSTKNKNDGKSNQNKHILLRNRTKKTDSKQNPTNKKGKRSKIQQQTEEKNTIKTPISIRKKRTHEQSTVYNTSSASTESPKALKRSLVIDNDLPSPKRTKSQNKSKDQKLNNNRSRVMKAKHRLLNALSSKELNLDKRGPYVYLVKYQQTQNRNMKTRSHSTRRI